MPGSGYTPGGGVSIEALNSAMTRAEATVDRNRQRQRGKFQTWLVVGRCAGPDLWHFYSGKLWIAADGAPRPTAWATRLALPTALGTLP